MTTESFAANSSRVYPSRWCQTTAAWTGKAAYERSGCLLRGGMRPLTIHGGALVTCSFSLEFVRRERGRANPLRSTLVLFLAAASRSRIARPDGQALVALRWLGDDGHGHALRASRTRTPGAVRGEERTRARSRAGRRTKVAHSETAEKRRA
jgi:hypothetical protein